MLVTNKRIKIVFIFICFFLVLVSCKEKSVVKNSDQLDSDTLMIKSLEDKNYDELFELFEPGDKKVIENSNQLDYETLMIKYLDENRFDIVLELLDLGCDPNIVYKGESLLSYCAFNNLTEVCIKAIEKGADINWINPEDGISILNLAISHNNLELAKMLLEHNVSLDYESAQHQNYLALSLKDRNDKESNLYLDYSFTKLLLVNTEYREKLKNEKKTIYILIRNWTENIPEFLDLIYGEDDSYIEKYPVVMISVEENRPDALKFFVDKNANTTDEYYDAISERYITPLERAYELEYQLSYFDENEHSEGLDRINQIIEILK